MQSQNELIETNFYKCTLLVQKLGTDYWLCRVRINRKDTDECVDGFNVFGESSIVVMENAKDKLHLLLENLQQPADWKSAVREILSFYQDYLKKEENFFCKLNGDESINDFAILLCGALDMTRTRTLAIVKKVSMLSNEELMELVRASDNEYSNIHDEDVHSLMYAKKALFQYILKPSDEVIKVHEWHCKYIDNAVRRIP